MIVIALMAEVQHPVERGLSRMSKYRLGNLHIVRSNICKVIHYFLILHMTPFWVCATYVDIIHEGVLLRINPLSSNSKTII